MLTSSQLLTKSWRAHIEATTPELTPLFDHYVKDSGLVGVCAAFDAASFDAIRRKPASLRTADILVALANYDLATQLQVLRFGKRYTPEEVESTQEEREIREFLLQNNRVKMFDRGERARDTSCHPVWKDGTCTYEVDKEAGNFAPHLPWWLEKKLKDVSSYLWPTLRDLEKREREGAFVFDPWTDMPTGVTAEGLRNHFEKMLAYDCVTNDLNRRFPTIAFTEATASKLVCVPKNYKQPRLICEEPLTTQCKLRRGEKILRYVISSTNRRAGNPRGPISDRMKALSPHDKSLLTDQSRNQELAKLGSKTGFVATIDCSRASDSLTYSVANAVIPKAWVNDVLGNLSTRVELPNGRVRHLYICGTMGACVTFPLEDWTFWCILAAAGETCIHYGVGDYSWFAYCAVFGDDIICPSEWVETVYDFLAYCGFTVNAEKSFSGDFPYRESCGAEYYNGESVASIYWPRRKYNGTIADLPSLIELSNRLFSIGSTEAARIVASEVDRLCPGVPRVAPFSNDLGIWSYSVTRRLEEGVGGIIVHVFVEHYLHQDHAVILTDVPLEHPFYRSAEYALVSTFDTRLFSAKDRFDPFTRANGGYLYDLYRYYRFLELGPDYPSELDRVLHVSSLELDTGRKVPTGYRVRKSEYTLYDVIFDD